MTSSVHRGRSVVSALSPLEISEKTQSDLERAVRFQQGLALQLAGGRFRPSASDAAEALIATLSSVLATGLHTLSYNVGNKISLLFRESAGGGRCCGQQQRLLLNVSCTKAGPSAVPAPAGLAKRYWKESGSEWVAQLAACQLAITGRLTASGFHPLPPQLLNSLSVDPDAECKYGLYFRDGRRKVDYILVEEYEGNLVEAGLELERDEDLYHINETRGLLKKINSVLQKITDPIQPRVAEHRPQTTKRLSYPFSREKQHLFDLSDKDSFFDSKTRSTI
ncbi:hypothetical protein CB1_000164014, partial [Camelus ferus]